MKCNSCVIILTISLLAGASFGADRFDRNRKDETWNPTKNRIVREKPSEKQSNKLNDVVDFSAPLKPLQKLFGGGADDSNNAKSHLTDVNGDDGQREKSNLRGKFKITNPFKSKEKITSEIRVDQSLVNPQPPTFVSQTTTNNANPSPQNLQVDYAYDRSWWPEFIRKQLASITQFRPDTQGILNEHGICPEEKLKNINKIVVFGDLHGDLNAFLDLVQFLQLARMNEQGQLHWIAPRGTVAVCLGDVMDRGPFSYELLEHIFDLRVAARSQGGDIIFVIGNHELGNISNALLFMKYVSDADLMQFMNEQDATNDISYETLKALRERGYRLRGTNMFFLHKETIFQGKKYLVDELRSRWYKRRMEKLAPNTPNSIGTFLYSLFPVVQIGPYVFVSILVDSLI